MTLLALILSSVTQHTLSLYCRCDTLVLDTFFLHTADVTLLILHSVSLLHTPCLCTACVRKWDCRDSKMAIPGQDRSGQNRTVQIRTKGHFPISSKTSTPTSGQEWPKESPMQTVLYDFMTQRDGTVRSLQPHYINCYC